MENKHTYTLPAVPLPKIIQRQQGEANSRCKYKELSGEAAIIAYQSFRTSFCSQVERREHNSILCRSYARLRGI